MTPPERADVVAGEAAAASVARKRVPFSQSRAYQLFMLALCVSALAGLALQSSVHLAPGTKTILEYSDFAVCCIFLLDFVWSLTTARDRWGYFKSWGWLDLLSSIPTLDIARVGRLARILRVFRVLRGLRATRLLATTVLRRRAENTFLAASLVAVLLVVFCSIAILHFEAATPEANIVTADDAVWWAFATIPTVGYGDRYPVTGEGRAVAMILMAAGVALFGTFSGFLAAWFLGPGVEESETDIATLRREIVAMRKSVEALGPSRRDPRLEDSVDQSRA